MQIFSCGALSYPLTNPLSSSNYWTDVVALHNVAFVVSSTPSIHVKTQFIAKKPFLQFLLSLFNKIHDASAKCPCSKIINKDINMLVYMY